MILGPAIVAVTVAVLEVWHYRAGEEDAPPPAEAAAEAKAKANSTAPDSASRIESPRGRA